jgi:hypothetical protein
VDSLELAPSHPSNVRIFAHSALPAGQGQSSSQVGSVFYSDMTYYTQPNGQAGVWDSGTGNWIPALADCTGSGPCPVGVMTSNVLRLFGQGPAGQRQPSVANWRNFYPGG